MDKKELIDKITSEVIAKLKSQDYSESLGSTSGKNIFMKKGVNEENTIVSNIHSPSDIARYIDHTLLKPEAKEEQVKTLCEEAIQYGFYSVCINSSWTDYCARKLRGTKVKVTTVVGFPLGAMDSRTKTYETRNAIENGADEIDMVINIGALRNGDLETVEKDLRAVLLACRKSTVTKAIIETCLLNDQEKVIASELAKKVGYNFVKTSTGFSSAGATAHDVVLIRRTVGPKMEIKAAGGISTFEDAMLMLRSGATRLGCSKSVQIVTTEIN
jgi:deoxyribose-phosphate aldolase